MCMSEVMYICLLLTVITLAAPVCGQKACNPCPVADGSGCSCNTDQILCMGYGRQFPVFQPTTAICNTSIFFVYCNFKDIPTKAFNLGANVTVYSLRITKVLSLEMIQPLAFSGLALQNFELQEANGLHTLSSKAFSGLSASEMTITYTGLSKFPTSAFEGIQNLRSLSITKSQISFLDNETFHHMSNLVYLDLDMNSIISISDNSFALLPNLRQLRLRSNLICNITSRTFAGLMFLTDLFLDDNGITTVTSYAFSGLSLPRLSTLSLEFNSATTVQEHAFDTLPELQALSISMRNGNDIQKKCLKFISIGCSDFPKLHLLGLQAAFCVDILTPLISCISSLRIVYSNNENQICLPPILDSLAILQNLTIMGNAVTCFNLASLGNLHSLNSYTQICDEALRSTPYLRSVALYNQRGYYVPKPVQKMQYLTTLNLGKSPIIICNCSSYWLYNYTTSHHIDISGWKCLPGNDGYINVTQYLEAMHDQGRCKGTQPDFQPWNRVTCEKLCPDGKRTTNENEISTKSTPQSPSHQPESSQFTQHTEETSESSTSTSTESSIEGTKDTHESKILYSVLGAMAFVLVLAAIAGYYWYRRFHRLRRIKVEQLAMQSREPPSDNWEISRTSLQITDEKLGTGAFGVVVKGKLLTTSPKPPHSSGTIVREAENPESFVAVKMLPRHADSTAKAEFLREIETMKCLGQHPHLVSLVACITVSEPVCLIVDYCSDGDLLKFLRARKPNADNPDMNSLSLKDQLSFAWQVADGMSFLSSKGYAHRDLAARNILVHQGNIARVSDFGLCRLTNENTATYITKGGPLPLRWLAPECIHDYEFTTASDVWAFGILLFELVSFGSTPYKELHLSEIEPSLAEGKRMRQVDGCPDNLYQVMLQCWQKVPEDRPSFPQLRSQLMDMLEKESSESCYYLNVYPDE